MKRKLINYLGLTGLIAFLMMMVGAIGQSAVLGLYLFNGFGEKYGA